MIRASVAALIALAVVVACNKTGVVRSAGPATPTAPAMVAREEAARLLARGDYAAAEGQYRAALQMEPEDVTLHHGLGTTLSHLNRPDEARVEFEWVVSHAPRGREEFIVAQQWLNQLVGSASGTETSSPSAREGKERTSPGETKPVGTMKGKTEWPGITPESRIISLELKLTPEMGGESGPLKLGIRLGNTYRFPKIPAGSYQLVARAQGRDLWKRVVVIAADAEEVVDLTPDTSLVSPSEFPSRDSG